MLRLPLEPSSSPASGPLHFELHSVDPTGARAGVLTTRRGAVPTPVFMPVATHANFRNVAVDEAAAAGARIILANTYHLMLRPGIDVFRAFGGIHRFMQWSGPVLTDSGGFQIFSLPEDRVITEQGARFRSFHDNSRQLLSPETSIAMQQAIGSEIMMVLDVCIDARSDERASREAMERTHRWALRSLAARDAVDTGQALFAIVQGGVHPHLRDQSVAFLTAHPFDGFAIGGLAVGEKKDARDAVTERVTGQLPVNKPRYLMGVGTPLDLLEGIRRGIDMFDCIIPTKMAQQAYAYTSAGEVRVSRQEYRLSQAPLDAACDCHVCQTYSLGYLHHLMKGKHTLGSRLISVHNLRHFQVVMAAARAAILRGEYDAFHNRMKADLAG